MTSGSPLTDRPLDNLTDRRLAQLEEKAVTNYCLTGRGGTMFLAADHPEGNTKDGEYLAKKLDEAIKIVDALKMKPLLGSIVTYNATVMLKANKVLDNEEEYPDGN